MELGYYHEGRTDEVTFELVAPMFATTFSATPTSTFSTSSVFALSQNT